MIIITGISGGIGSELAESFLSSGETVYGIYFSHEPSIEKHKGLLIKQLDIKNSAEVDIWISSIKESLQNVTLINSAGISYNAMAHKADAKLWQEVFEVNVFGTFNLIKSLLPIMREQAFGRIINMSSVVAQKGFPGTSAYSASKAALWGLTKSIALENAGKNITINNLNLGYMNAGMIHQVPTNYQEEILKTIPMNKFGSVENIYNSIKLLMNSDYITGTNIDINGGLY